MDLRPLSKADLHRHLEGAIRLSTIIDIYREAGEPLPADTPDELASAAQVLQPMDSLEEVLSFFRIAQGALRSYVDIERITYEAVDDLASDNVRLAELRFSPDFMSRPAGLDWDGVMEAVLAGLERARSEHEVAVGLIAIVSRSYGMESARRTVEFAVRHREHLVGFDLADDELAWPAGRFVEVLEPLRHTGLPLTAHYGESGGPEYPKEAIERLGVRRLGHGVSVGRSAEVTVLAIERGVALEMCPTSNVRTRAVPSIEEHPARRLLHQGALVTINTDDPGLFGIDLTHEFDVARNNLGFEESDFRAVTENAIAASFLPESVKAEVRRRHFGWLTDG
ncbi:MAG TPA: adenosine deaminase [Actinomycetota bacterium]|jgi:adenosine deaminase|nr:adenosine deaminase [Actinomycetota bacterium]